MSLIRRPDSKYWHIKFIRNGVTHQKSSKTACKKDAAQIEKMWKESLFRTEQLNDPERITIKEAINLYVDRIQVTKKIDHTRKSIIYFIQENLNTDRMLHHLTNKDAEHLMQVRAARGNSPATIKLTFAILQAINNYADYLGFKFSPLKMPEVKMNKKKLRYLSREEEQRFLKELAPKCRWGHQRHYRLDAYEITLLLLDTGARYHEICNLKWTDLDFEKRTIHLHRPKVDNQSLFYMSNRTFNTLQRRHRDRISPTWVFTDVTGFVARKERKFIIRDALKRAGLEDVTIHTLRHTFASRMVQEGMTLQEVGSLLGHTNTQTTLIYAHLNHKQVSYKAAEIMNRLQTVDLALVKG